jgi:hypothetical protein
MRKRTADFLQGKQDIYTQLERNVLNSKFYSSQPCSTRKRRARAQDRQWPNFPCAELDSQWLHVDIILKSVNESAISLTLHIDLIPCRPTFLVFVSFACKPWETSYLLLVPTVQVNSKYEEE